MKIMEIIFIFEFTMTQQQLMNIKTLKIKQL